MGSGFQGSPLSCPSSLPARQLFILGSDISQSKLRKTGDFFLVHILVHIQLGELLVFLVDQWGSHGPHQATLLNCRGSKNAKTALPVSEIKAT